MTDRIVRITDDFWTVRGAFRILGLLNIGTQTSIARLAGGGFALLDSYPFVGYIKREIFELTDQGRAVKVIINLHPFHTVHVEAVAAMFPDARLFGTARHHSKFPHLKWEPERTESAEFAALFSSDFDFSAPRGVQFIPDKKNLHFSSVLAIHRSSRVLHVDDTLNWMPLPWGGRLDFHPTLKSVLNPGPTAANEFRSWAQELAERCESVQHVCTAHARLAPRHNMQAGAVAAQVRQALARVEPVLRGHR